MFIIASQSKSNRITCSFKRLVVLFFLVIVVKLLLMLFGVEKVKIGQPTHQPPVRLSVRPFVSTKICSDKFCLSIIATRLKLHTFLVAIHMMLNACRSKKWRSQTHICLLHVQNEKILCICTKPSRRCRCHSKYYMCAYISYGRAQATLQWSFHFENAKDRDEIILFLFWLLSKYHELFTW